MTARPEHRIDRSGVALAVGAAVTFGTLAISGKFAYEAGAHPFPLLATRFWLASVLLLLYHLVRRRSPMAPRGELMRMMIGGGFLYGSEATLFFAALQYAPASVVGLVFYSYPVWTMLLGFATRLEKFRWKTVGALVLGSTGVALVFSLPSTSLRGPLLAVSAAVMVAIYMIFMQVMLRDVAPLAAAMWTSVGAAVVLTVASAFARKGLPAEAIVPAVGLAIASALAFALLYEAIARIGSARSAIAAMMEPVTTLVLAALFLGEEMSLRILLGAALIVAVLPLLTSPPAEPPH